MYSTFHLELGKSLSLLSNSNCRNRRRANLIGGCELDFLHMLILVLVLSTSLCQIKIKLESKKETLVFMFYREFPYQIQ